MRQTLTCDIGKRILSLTASRINKLRVLWLSTTEAILEVSNGLLPVLRWQQIRWRV
jgi:hypothetical protein